MMKNLVAYEFAQLIMALTDPSLKPHERHLVEINARAKAKNYINNQEKKNVRDR